MFSRIQSNKRNTCFHSLHYLVWVCDLHI